MSTINIQHIYGLSIEENSQMEILNQNNFILKLGNKLIQQDFENNKQIILNENENDNNLNLITFNLSPLKKIIALGYHQESKNIRQLIYSYTIEDELIQQIQFPYNGEEIREVYFITDKSFKVLDLVQQQIICSYQEQQIQMFAINNINKKFIAWIQEDNLKTFNIHLKGLTNISNKIQQYNKKVKLENIIYFQEHIICQQENQLILADQNGIYVNSIELQDNVLQIILNQNINVILKNNTIISLCLYNQQFQIIKNFNIKPQQSVFKIKECKIKNVQIFNDHAYIWFQSLENFVQHSTNVMFKYSLEENDIQEVVQMTDMFHNKPILIACLCTCKSILATYSEDRQIKIWDYLTKSLLFTISFIQEEILNFQIHPTGLYFVTSTIEKINYFNLQFQSQDRIKPFKQIINIKNCKLMKFSNGGQFLAVIFGVNFGNNISIYEFYSLSNEPLYQFKGHQGFITGLEWSQDDSVLISTANDGILCWNIDSVRSGKFCETSNNQRNIQFSKLAYNKINEIAYSIQSDNKIVQLNIFQQLDIQKQIQLNFTPQNIVVSPNGKEIFMSVEDQISNSFYIVHYNNQNFNNYSILFNHSRTINQLIISEDSKYLFSISDDGLIFQYQIQNKDQPQQNYYLNNYILVNKQDFDEQIQQNQNINQQLLEMNNYNHNIDFKNKEINYLEEQYQLEQENFNQRYHQIQKENSEIIQQLKDQLQNKNQENQQYTQDLENQLNNDFIELTDKLEVQKKNFMNEHQIKLNEKQEQEQKILDQLDQKENRLQNQLQQDQIMEEKIKIEYENMQKYFEKIIDIIKQENEIELIQLKQFNKQDLNSLQEQLIKAKSEILIIQKKIEQQKLEIQKYSETKNVHKQQFLQLDSQILILEQEVNVQKKEIAEKDKIITQKEKFIYNLKNRIHELEMFKQVLDFKIKELKINIQPREQEIINMKNETMKMDQKLLKFNQINQTLKQLVEQLGYKQNQILKDIYKQRCHNNKISSQVSKLKNKIYVLVQYLQDKDKFFTMFNEIYEEYVTTEEFKEILDQNINEECEDQKEFLEATVQVMQQNIQKDVTQNQYQNIQIMKQNVDLINQINKIRRLIKMNKQEFGIDKFDDNDQKKLEKLQQEYDHLLEIQQAKDNKIQELREKN